jgi:uncharacterized protein with gpF-like domain
MALSIPPRRQLAMMAVIERRYAVTMRAEIARAMRAYVRQWEETGGFANIPEHEQAVARIVERFANVATRQFAAAILDGGKTAGALERKDFAQTFARIARRYIMLEAVRKRITSIAETTRDMIVAAVDRTFADGLGQAAAARQIMAEVPLVSFQRAAVIARTETHGAANYGAMAAAKETGLALDKRWIAAEDERTRESHQEADGQTVDVDNAFDVGGEALMYPGDPNGSAGNVINCRCTVAYVPRGF